MLKFIEWPLLLFVGTTLLGEYLVHCPKPRIEYWRCNEDAALQTSKLELNKSGKVNGSKERRGKPAA